MIRIKFKGPIFKQIIFNDEMRLSKLAIVLLVFSAFIPIMLIVSLYSQHSANLIESELSNNMRLAVDQIKNNLDYRFVQIQESSESILSTADPCLESNSTSFEEQFNEFEKLNLLIEASEGKHMISKICLYVPDDKMYANQRDTFYPVSDIINSKNRDSQITHKPGVIWQETYGANIKDSGVLTNIISCRTTLVSKKNYDVTACVLQLNIEETELSKIFSAGLNTKEEIYLVNARGAILSHPNAALIGKRGLSEDELNVVLTEKTGHMSGRLSNNGDLVAFSKLNAVDWYLVMRLPKSEVYGSKVFSFDLTRVLLILAAIAAFSITLILIYSFVIETSVKRIDKAIIDLNNDGIERLSSLPEQNIKSHNVLAILENHANQLVVTIKTLMAESYESQLKARDYHLQALQAQINPHFLYNTLDAIKWMILNGNTQDSVWMLNAFSKYFRLCLSNGRDIVTLREELELNNSYLGMMQKRFSDVFTVEMDVDDDLMECLIPKLSLQPLVENALNYGILHNENNGCWLGISAKQENGKLVIKIKDNGNGMSQEQVNVIMTHKPGKTKGYGLANVNDRLKLFGGDDCGIVVNSELKKGTTVTLLLPIKHIDQNDT